jgi:probable F420-dependent oxidoreductase
VKIGLFTAVVNPFASADVLRSLGRRAEERGLHSIWVPEHVVLFDRYESEYPYSADGRIPSMPGSGMLDPLTTLTFLAACTTTIRLATGILLLPQRNPVYTAKEAATLDYLSGGRLDLGIGVGWLEEEFAAVGVPWPDRGRRTDECIDVLKACWTTDPSEYHGQLYDLPACEMFPKPVQQPHIPLHMGGESAAAMRRAARVGQGWYTFNRLPADTTEPLAQLARILEQHDRSRDDFSVTACPYFNGLTPEMVEQFAELGVDQVTALCVPTSPDDVEPALDALQPCIDRAASLS